MFNDIYKNIPQDIVKCAISLEIIGINEYAWKKNEIIKILEILRKERIAVLGGDVYRIVDNKIEFTYDSWYLNNDGDLDFVERSLDKAFSYVQEYEKANNRSKNIYVLVF